MENKEVVSIVIPIYNVEAYLRKSTRPILILKSFLLMMVLLISQKPFARNSSSKIHVFAMSDKLMVAYLQLEIRGLTWLQVITLLL